jgi:valyl-tRNA synthetase
MLMMFHVPTGTDHAGIATQSVVEKKLKKEEGITR